MDIGGANLKLADLSGHATASEFPLWRHPDELADRLIAELSAFPAAERVAVTMTGELADCFLDRAVGVRQIVDQVSQATAALELPAPVFYGVDGRFHDVIAAKQQTDVVAASNWHALATYVARSIAADGLLVDIGSTTTDLIPLRDGCVATTSRTDYDRLCEQSLVYLGGGRTPVCSIVDSLLYEGRSVPVMREVFATMDDVRLLLQYQIEAPDDLASADGKPRDRFHAANRLARMIGLDHRTASLAAMVDSAGQVHRRAQQLIAGAMSGLEQRGTGQLGTVVISGHADDLLPAQDSDTTIISLPTLLGTTLSRCCPAYAVAQLWSDESDYAVRSPIVSS
ncbi:tetrahydromethanopterin-linked C1 transfer pathway [Stieleria sp. TO1_6]|uniref:hydantoinase/oxoprolinase family protein n=1 Tax=Stieleria tagensis TaxID=2956795 RepID=UPI00209B7F0E|nr:hydantoinase/oxoprolinase family protein [Stieleria tagensis]MCO8125214.1 tetrahydromethanopterin-linked C1 transfer pathway [Stieleria tagensis]